jgi:peptidyl-prolyl cis-trans isomerase SurA
MPASVNQTSHLGWVTPNQLTSKAAKAVLSLPSPNQAIQPIATKKGWEIIYLDGVREQDLNQTNKRTAAIQAIRIQKANESYEIWLRRLKENAVIENRLVDQKKTSE